MSIKKLIPMACLTAVLGFSAPSTAQVTDAMKQVGHATVETTKKAGRATEKAGTKVGNETKNVFTGRPNGTTGKCKDGSYTKSRTRSACSRHGGVEKWY